jgi:hypothetical protein
MRSTRRAEAPVRIGAKERVEGILSTTALLLGLDWSLIQIRMKVGILLYLRALLLMAGKVCGLKAMWEICNCNQTIEHTRYTMNPKGASFYFGAEYSVNTISSDKTFYTYCESTQDRCFNNMGL